MTKHLAQARPAPATRPEARPRRLAEIVEKAGNRFAEHGYFHAGTQFPADELRVGKGTIDRDVPHQ